MGSAVALRSDYTAIDLRRLAKGYGDNRQIRRLLALAAVYDGMNRSEATRVGGLDPRQGEKKPLAATGRVATTSRGKNGA